MVLGIDLGTTYSAAAFVDENGNPQMIVNAEGRNTTPSVFFEDKPNEIIIGEVAKSYALIRPQDVVSVVKNDMGKKEKYTMSSGKEYVPEEISSFIIRKMVKDAENYTGENIQDVVITVPAYFNDAQRKATEDAAKIAGVNMIASINEPTAAMLCYVKKNNIQKGNIMIYDLGGGTFDASIVQVNGDEINVLSTDGSPKTGGHFFDEDIVGYVCDYMRDNHGIDLETPEYINELQELYVKAENCKIQLSTRSSAPIMMKVGSVVEPIEITRDFFNSKLKRFYRMTEVKMKNALKNAGLTVSEIDTVLMVGGSSRIPFIEESVKSFVGRDVAKDINPDEAVAIGASIYGSIHGEDKLKKLFRDANSHSIGFVYINKDREKENYILIPKNSSLPAEFKQKVKTMIPNQEKIVLTVTEGESNQVEYVKTIEELAINLPPNLPKDTEVIITYMQDEYQLLHIYVNIPAKENWGYEHKMQRESNLTEEDIQMMTGIALACDVR